MNVLLKSAYFSKCLFTALIFLLIQNVQANNFKTQQWQTANGTRVIFYQAMEVPILYINVAFAAGSAYDDAKFGLSALTSSSMNQGSLGMDANQIAENLADTGAQLMNEVSHDMVVLSLKTLTKPEDMQKSISTFAAIINQPDFPQDAFVREKNQQLLAIEQVKDSPDELGNQILFQKLYQNHPYAHPINGIKETVNALQREDVVQFYKRYFVGKNAVIVLVGAIDTITAHQLAEQITGQLPKGEPALAIPLAPEFTATEKISIEYPSSQTILRLGQIGITHHDQDYFPLLVGNYILGGGALVSRLALEVREKRGLTYGVTSQFMPMPGRGPFIISLSTQNKEANTALQVTMDTLSNYLSQGPSEQELIAAKQYLMGNFPLSLASNTNIANMLLKMAFYKLPEDYLDTYVARINGVTVQEIKQAFQKKLHINELLIIAVGKM